MFDAKKLTEQQVAAIRGWADEGAQLADIQKRMEQEMEIRLTYMDTRFLVLDLGIELQKEEEPTPEPEGEKGVQDLTEDDIEVMPPPAAGVSKVRVTVDEIARPGVMVSGKVTFSDGQSGMWYVDNMGRLGVDPDTPGYQPTQSDLMIFQRELQATMESR